MTQKPALQRRVPGKVGKVASAGYEDWHARQPCSRDPQQIGPQIVRVYDMKSASAQKPCQAQHLVDAAWRVHASAGLEFHHRNG